VRHRLWARVQRLQQLALDEPMEDALSAYQLIMGTALHDPVFLQDENAIWIADGAEAMGDDDARRVHRRQARPTIAWVRLSYVRVRSAGYSDGLAAVRLAVAITRSSLDGWEGSALPALRPSNLSP